MTKAVLQNYLTTLFGLLSGLPVIVLGVFVPGTSMALSPQHTHVLMISGGIGLVGLGLVSKAFNVHSTLKNGPDGSITSYGGEQTKCHRDGEGR